MKTVFVLLLATLFLFSGALNVLKQVGTTKALEEIIGFISLVKTEVHYTTADFEKIFLKGKAQNYKYLSFYDNQIFLNKSAGERINEDFNSFINKIGTTDEEGQLNICQEYKERFEEILRKRKIKTHKIIQNSFNLKTTKTINNF